MHTNIACLAEATDWRYQSMSRMFHLVVYLAGSSADPSYLPSRITTPDTAACIPCKMNATKPAWIAMSYCLALNDVFMLCHVYHAG